MEKVAKLVKFQFWLLLAGTIFAWANFGVELKSWMNNSVCTAGCAAGASSPFVTPCFYGALFFLLAFLVSWKIKSAIKKNQ